MQTREKTSGESVLYDIDCSLLLATAETISSVTSLSAVPVTVPPVTFGTPSVSPSAITYTDVFGSTRVAPAGQVIQVRISGGLIEAGAEVRDYFVHALFATNLNPAVEAVVRLRLNDTPGA